MRTNWIRWLFSIAALYEGLRGIALLLFPLAILSAYGVEPPNHIAYLQFPALLLITFAVMLLRVAGDPVGRRELMLYGVALKAAYVVTVFGHYLTTGIPSMWVPWAWADLVFLMLFLAAWNATTGHPVPTEKKRRRR